MKIFIMTRGRVDRQWTVKSLKHVPEVHFVCPEEECAKLEDLYGRPAIDFDHPSPNQSNKFQFLLERNLFPDEDHIVILDDDLTFSERITKEDGTVGLRQLNPNSWGDLYAIDTMFKHIDSLLFAFPQVGVHPRQMGHTAPYPYKKNGKCITVYGVNRKMLEDLGFNRDWRVDYLPIFGDVFLNLHVLEHGGENVLTTEWCVDWKASQAPGGCSIYRTMELQEQAVDLLVEKFPGFVKKVVKTPKASKWLGDSRVDFTVQWKKLAAAGAANRHP